jgi:hypothetical protein
MHSLYNRVAGQNVERIAALSDGIFAVAMTVLVLDLRVPAAEAIHSEHDLWHALITLSEEFSALFDLSSRARRLLSREGPSHFHAANGLKGRFHHDSGASPLCVLRESTTGRAGLQSCQLETTNDAGFSP